MGRTGRRETFLDYVAGLVAADAWVTEWEYAGARPALAARADLMVWLDLLFWTKTSLRVVRRRVRREEIWNGNLEPPFRRILADPEYIVRWVVTTRRKYLDEVPRLDADLPGLLVVRLRSNHDLERWMSGLFARAVALSSLE